jgi:hypothetical protein
LLVASEPDDEVRIVEGTVALTGMVLPPDCVLESSLRAMRTMGVRAAAAGSNGTNLLGGKVGKPLHVIALYVRVVGRPAAARR